MYRSWIASSLLIALIPGPSFGVGALLSGDPALVVVDGDDDGPDGDDCTLFGDLTGNAFTVTSQQQMDSSPLLVCSGNYLGSVFQGSDESSDYIELDVVSGPANVSEPPFTIELFDEQPTPDGPPVRLDETVDKFLIKDSDTGDILASAVVCSSGQAAAVVDIPGFTSMLIPLEFETVNSDRYLKLADRPFGIAPTGQSALDHDAYVPLTSDDRLTLALADAPSDFLIEIDFADLPDCPGSTEAPTATEWGLAFTALALLAGGTAMLSRRESFRIG